MCQNQRRRVLRLHTISFTNVAFQKCKGYHFTQVTSNWLSIRYDVDVILEPLLLKVMQLKVGLSPSKAIVLFASMEALLNWWKMLFTSF